MKIPVLLRAFASNELIAASRDAGSSTGLLSAAKWPEQFHVDPRHRPVPLGSGDSASMLATTREFRVAEAFAVRGHLDVESADAVPEKLGNQEVFSDLSIMPFITCTGSPPVGAMSDVATLLQVNTLQQKSLTGANVAIAIVDTGINLEFLKRELAADPIRNAVRLDTASSWSPADAGFAAGLAPVGHGSMCAYDALIAAPEATLLDYAILASRAPGGSVVGSSISSALQAFTRLLSEWAVNFGPASAAAKYSALVVSNSWGVYRPDQDFPVGHPGRYCDNPRHPFHIVVQALADSGADIVFAAGNCGAECAAAWCDGRTTETIMGANAHAAVLTVAGCDTTRLRVGYSSQGPSIRNMPQQKPDITAYTHFLGSRAFGRNEADSGTSTACPVAAGCIAALRTRLSHAALSPLALFSQLKTSAASASTGSGWNADYGFGIIDPLATAQSLGL